jgi:starvation-inducible DNA-binding protein
VAQTIFSHRGEFGSTLATMKASKELSANLQAVLVDLIELGIQGKQAHWNVVGSNFRGLHLQLDEIIAVARTHADEIAERMRALEAIPDGRSETVAKDSSLAKYPSGQVDTKEVVTLISERLHGVSNTARRVHDAVDAEDPTTADMLHGIIGKLEQFAWMVSAETVKPRKGDA